MSTIKLRCVLMSRVTDCLELLVYFEAENSPQIRKFPMIKGNVYVLLVVTCLHAIDSCGQ